MKTAFDYALDVLTVSSKTEKQLYTALKRKGYDESACRDAIAKVKDYGYINDEAFGRRYVESNSHIKGKRRIEADLRLKGLSEDDIQSAVSDWSEEDELSAALMLTERHFKDYSDKNKIFRYLAYRGFSQNVIYSVVRSLCSDFEED